MKPWVAGAGGGLQSHFQQMAKKAAVAAAAAAAAAMAAKRAPHEQIAGMCLSCRSHTATARTSDIRRALGIGTARHGVGWGAENIQLSGTLALALGVPSAGRVVRSFRDWKSQTSST
ncbi:hypothetical protein AWZ03_008219 [Drosophila navojoa]|uniref:Uncharacterized protein n=1 Tax=Drosophila navojoa TaxID=7232 RepID=A0A484BC15_DRONA|nr:hypothetical protein AWZ03_008219 [Drosophila navojoa]